MSGASSSRLGWYARRLGRMSAGEVAWRVRDKVVQTAWSMRQVRREDSVRPPTVAGPPQFMAVLPEGAAARVPEAARAAVLATADRLLAGEWEVLGMVRTDLAAPDWFFDPVTGRRAPADGYAFRVNHRTEDTTGNVKQIWEVSRLQHLTLLAAAWAVSHEEAYARRVADQLRSWWQENTFLSGVNWTTGIEVGIRLISLVWIRRLLGDWPQAADLFERNDVAVGQVRWHQQYLAAFRSRGSSANNHVIAEAAGQLVASCAFPWFRESKTWRRTAARLLGRELARNTFPSGIDRELASGYQSFVAELVLLAAVESEAAGHPVGADLWQRLCAMVDSGAALLDATLRPPRQGDGDEGRALLLDAPETNRWPSLLSASETVFGRLDWWPPTAPDVASTFIGAMQAAAKEIPGRPAARPWHFPGAGIALLRTTGERDPEIWCRCDGGPHGFLSIAAHAHADALSIEVRYGGVDVFADPGTYCYHGEPAWRSYFRSTIAHNTIEIAGRSQSSEAGPFLWLRHANAREVGVLDIGDAAEWTAEHDGYRSLGQPVWHRRCVRLDRVTRSIDIVDEVSVGSQDVRLAFHLGPNVTADLLGSCAVLRWPGPIGSATARLELPRTLRWSAHRGQVEPILGWYSSGLGHRTPSVTLIGQGTSEPAQPFITRLEFLDISNLVSKDKEQPGVSRSLASAVVLEVPDARPEAG